MYQELFNHHSEILKAMAHPKRLEIIHLLRDQELCVSDIHSMLDLPQANISQHLMILREARIVTSDKKGKKIYYQLSDPKLIKASDLVREVSLDSLDKSKIPQESKLKMKDLVPLTHDPVCGMRVSPKLAGSSHEYQNQEYYFCASGCMKAFAESPKKYV